MKRKRRINAPKYARLDNPICVKKPKRRDCISPVLLKEYQDVVHKNLEELPSLTVLEALESTPTLSRYLRTELDRWYIIYEASLETSVFQNTILHIGEIKFGFQEKARSFHEEIARDYAEIIKKISLHNQMLQMMASADFPGKKVELKREHL